jgi:hypothetical protein
MMRLRRPTKSAMDAVDYALFSALERTPSPAAAFCVAVLGRTRRDCGEAVPSQTHRSCLASCAALMSHGIE